MRAQWIWRPLAITGAFGIILAICAVGVRADTPATTYYACVTTQSGEIHLVSEGTTCSNGAQLITWNQQGPQGPAGPQGPQGPQGPAGVSGYQVVTAQVTIPPYGQNGPVVVCPSGKVVTGGGYQDWDVAVDVVENEPRLDGTAWLVSAVNNGPNTVTIQGFAICTYAN